jgi:hypothetical protein
MGAGESRSAVWNDEIPFRVASSPLALSRDDRTEAANGGARPVFPVLADGTRGRQDKATDGARQGMIRGVLAESRIINGS